MIKDCIRIAAINLEIFNDLADSTEIFLTYIQRILSFICYIFPFNKKLPLKAYQIKFFVFAWILYRSNFEIVFTVLRLLENLTSENSKIHSNSPNPPR